MNWRAYRASVRREVQRGRRSLAIFAAISLGACVLVALLPGEYGMIPGLIAFVICIFAVFGPSADLGQDRLMGHFEFDRALPVPPRLLAAGRLTGAAIRTLPFPVGTLAFGMAIARGSDSGGPLPIVVITLATVAALLGGLLVCWTLLALNAKWAFRRIWWLGPTLGLAPQVVPAILPASVKHAIGGMFSDLSATFQDVVSQPIGVVAVLAVVLMMPLIVFSGSTLLFASGIRTYRYDPTAMHVGLGSLPRRELSAIGRGPALAVARLRLRLSLEQFRREFLMIALLLLLVAFNPGGLRDFARTYVRVLAALIPGGIVIQLGQARAKGYLETMQHLPHRASVIGAGHLLAIAILAVPGSAVLLLDRLLIGEVMSFAQMLAVWGWFVTIAWIGATLTVWLRRLYAVALFVVPLLLVGVWVAVVGLHAAGEQIVAGGHAFRAFRQSAGPSLPLAAMAIAIAIGMPVFANGLQNYEYSPK